jgi:phosphopantetheine--protein transferase-like protein
VQHARIGNDVIDLTVPGSQGKEHDRRFLDRVFTPVEQARISSAPSPTAALWLCWAAKEAAYKALKKHDSSLIFAHRQFELVDLPVGELWSGARITACGRMRHGERNFGVALTLTTEWAHASVVIGPRQMAQTFERVVDVRSDALARIERPLRDDELASVRFPESAHVRWLGHDLLDEAGFTNFPDRNGFRIVRPTADGGHGPPLVIGPNDEPFPGVDISLSHHGSFIAGAVTLAS